VTKQKLFVVKIGGNVIDNDPALKGFLKYFAQIDAPAILVHGGGKIATSIGNKLGIESKYIDGRRLTDDATIGLVTMVYGGLVNKKIVASLQALNCNAIGLTGADANIIPANRRPVVFSSSGDREKIDYGWVGDIDASRINTNILSQLLLGGIKPVLAPLTHDGEGHILNTNADTIASSVAVALSQHFNVRLIYCFEKKGVLEDVDDENSVISGITKAKYQQLKNGNKLFAGILPKLDNAFAAIDAGVKEVLIGDAGDLIANTSQQTTGTLITK
jgi:acetylglutamate kinase